MNERFKCELDNFIIGNLIKRLNSDYTVKKENFPNYWEKNRHYRFKEKIKSENADFPLLTNHEICHEMFWNAFMGNSEMYIQMRDLISDDEFSNVQSDNKTITLQCSLLTSQMLDYDTMMFNAMGDVDDMEYRNAALEHYRPYLFDFVAEIESNKYKELQELQRKLMDSNGGFSFKENVRSPYIWLACVFVPDKSSGDVIDGYVVQSASRVTKINVGLRIIEGKELPIDKIKDFLDGYTLSNCLKDDDEFIRLIGSKIGHNHLSSIDVYKVGNGNCVFAQGVNNNISFFYDIGFNCRQRPRKNYSDDHYNYCDTMNEIYKKDPSFVILSHWDMDHIAGSFAAKDRLFEKDWFAPDCYDSCLSAKRLAKYLDYKNHLFLAKRCGCGRQIGILNRTSATYKLYMGKKCCCDKSYPNCEGIVIEYEDKIKNKTLLMMGDVNYASFNAARTAKGDPLFADSNIDFLIVPHHGSEHTDYKQITDNGRIVKKGIDAVICCKNIPSNNRPNSKHRAELEKRFVCVRTTEEVSLGNYSITITI